MQTDFKTSYRGNEKVLLFFAKNKFTDWSFKNFVKFMEKGNEDKLKKMYNYGLKDVSQRNETPKIIKKHINEILLKEDDKAKSNSQQPTVINSGDECVILAGNKITGDVTVMTKRSKPQAENEESSDDDSDSSNDYAPLKN